MVETSASQRLRSAQRTIQGTVRASINPQEHPDYHMSLRGDDAKLGGKKVLLDVRKITRPSGAPTTSTRASWPRYRPAAHLGPPLRGARPLVVVVLARSPARGSLRRGPAQVEGVAGVGANQGRGEVPPRDDAPLMLTLRSAC